MRNLAHLMLLLVLLCGGLAFFSNKDFTSRALVFEALGLAAIATIPAALGVFAIFIATGMGVDSAQTSELPNATLHFLFYNGASILGFVLPILISLYCAVRYLRKGEHMFSMGAWGIMVTYFIVGLRLLSASSGV